jgi:hypothetical protein
MGAISQSKMIKTKIRGLGGSDEMDNLVDR